MKPLNLSKLSEKITRNFKRKLWWKKINIRIGKIAVFFALIYFVVFILSVIAQLYVVEF